MTQVSEIPKTKAERDAWLGSSPQISDDIIAELGIQFKGYSGYDFKKAQQMAMDALKAYGSERVYTVPITQEMFDAKDYGFRLKEKNDDSGL